MKSLKKLLAVLVVVTLMAGMIAVPAFAASFNYEDEAKVLYDLGLFKGKSETEYKPALEDRLLREEGVALLLRLFKLEEEALKMDEKEAKDLLNQKFKDADEIAAWAVKYVAYAVKNEIVVGRPDGKFAPKDNLIGREFAKMVLAQLGYKQDVDFDYKFSIVELANATGLSMSEASRMDEAVLLRDDVVGMSFYSLLAEYVAGANAGKTVIEVVVGNDESLKAIAIEAGLMEEPVIVEVAAIPDIEINVGDALNLPAKVKATYSDGKEAEVAVKWPQVDTSKAMAKTEITGTIEGTDVVAKVNVTIKEVVLKVDSVTADNLIEVVVVYNQDVSGNDAVANKDNYSLDVGKVKSVKVDGNIAVLRLESAIENQKKAKLTISDKILPAKETIEFTFFDATLPEVLGLEATGPKEFTVTFSEPIEEKGTVTVKSGTSTLSVNYGAIETGTARVKIPLYSTLVDGKEYVITIQGFKDYAKYNNVIKTITYNYVKDTTAPVAEIEAATQEYVVVKFNKPVRGIVKEQFSHTFSAWIASKVTSDADGAIAIDSAKSYDKVYVWFYTGNKTVDKPIPEGEISFRILGKATAEDNKGYEIKDLWDNKFETATFTISVAADKTAPEVKEITVTAENAISIEFSKKVSFGKDNIEILDNEGKAISDLTLTFDPTTDATKFTVTFSKGLAGKTIIVNVKNVYDATLNSNKLNLYSETIEITDKTAPNVTEVTVDKTNNLLYVFFNEDIDEATGLNAGNYYLYNIVTVDGQQKPEYTKLSKTPSFFEGSRIVKFTLTDDEENKIAANTKLFVTGVKDVAGNEIVPVVTSAIAEIGVKQPAIEDAKATALNTIEVLFTQQLGLVDKEAFVVNGIAGVAIASMDEQLSDGKTKLILTLDKEMPYDAAGVSVQITSEGAKLLKNLFDVSPNQQKIGVTDAIAPVLDGDPVKVDNEPKIVLTFKEEVKASNVALAATDFVITDKDGKQLVAGIDYQVIKDKQDKLITIELLDSRVSYLGKLTIKTADSIKYITDITGNKMAAFSKDITLKGKSIYGFSFSVPANIVANTEITVPVTFKATTVNDDGYAHIRFVFNTIEKPNDQATVTFKATDTNNVGYTFINSGEWGPAKGFPISKDYSATTDWKITFSAAGQYTIEFTAIDLDKSNAEIAKGTATVVVAAPAP